MTFSTLRGPHFIKNNAIFEFLVKKYVDIGGSKFSKMWIFRVKKVEKVDFSLFLRKNDFIDFFQPEKSAFLKIRTHLYRRIF